MQLPEFNFFRFDGAGTEVFYIGCYLVEPKPGRFLWFKREDDNDDVVWRFLSYLRKDFNHRGVELRAFGFQQYEALHIIESLTEHDPENLDFSNKQGLVSFAWKTENKPKIRFRDHLPFANWKTIADVLTKTGTEPVPHDYLEKIPDEGDELSMLATPIQLKSNCVNLTVAALNIEYVTQKVTGASLGGSIPGGSIRAGKQLGFDIDQVPHNLLYEKQIRQCVYGGRNEVYKRYGENLNHFDVQDHYLSCHDVPIPIGRLTLRRPNIDKGVIAKVLVKVPTDLYIGPLPYHLPMGVVGFPVGTFEGEWDMREIRNAVNNFGVEILKWIWQYDCKEEVVLADFAELIIAARKADPIRKEFWKRFGVCYSGKTLETPQETEISNYFSIKDFSGWVPLDRKNEYWFQKRERPVYVARYERPLIGMRIRTEARIRHLDRLMQALKGGDLCYCDDDSIFTTADLPYSADPRPGELKLEDIITRAYFIRQKLYGLVTSDGPLIQKSAGYSDLKLTEEDFQGLLEGRIKLLEETKGLSNLKETAKEGLHVVTRHRTEQGKIPENRVYAELDSRPLILPDDLGTY